MRVDLRGIGKRSVRKIEFWYETKGILNGQADVTLFGMHWSCRRTGESRRDACR
jgi:hypothetical protein